MESIKNIKQILVQVICRYGKNCGCGSHGNNAGSSDLYPSLCVCECFPLTLGAQFPPRLQWNSLKPSLISLLRINCACPQAIALNLI